jgi:hypothetical protein
LASDTDSIGIFIFYTGNTGGEKVESKIAGPGILIAHPMKSWDTIIQKQFRAGL